MPVIEGNTSGSIASVPFNTPCRIISGFLVNKTADSIDVNVYVVTDTGDRSLIPYNKTIISNSIYVLEGEVIMKAGYYLLIYTNGSVDYYFSIEPL